MKLFLYLFTFLTFSVGAQESKPRFWDKLHLELDYNFLPYSYQWLYTYPEVDVYLTDHSSLQTSSVGLVYRNRYLNGGLKVNLFNLRMVQPSLGFNTLFALKNERYYLGPFISYGRTFGDNEFIAHQSWNVGLEGYFHSFHIGASYCQFFDFIQASSNKFKDMHGFNFQLGKSVGLVSPRKDKKNRWKNIYIEANLGTIHYHYFEASPNYAELSFYHIIGDLGINFRNERFKLFGEYSHSFIINNLFNVGGGVNLLPESTKVYFGPYLKNGYALPSDYLPGKLFSEFGFEGYYKNFHLIGGFARFSKIYEPTKYYDMSTFNIKLGYALPLGKRVKEN